MCDPGSKRWLFYRRLCWQAYIVIALLLQMFAWLQNRVAYELVYLQSQDMSFNILDMWTPQIPSKLYASPEAVWEVEGMQNYVAALSAHDLAVPGDVHAIAAFDLASTDPNTLTQGLADWMSFLSSSQGHVFGTVGQMPVSWGMLRQTVTGRLFSLIIGHRDFVSPADVPEDSFDLICSFPQGGSCLVAPPTIHLTSVLRGGVCDPSQTEQQEGGNWI